jgi:hypothetical protein
VKAHVICVNDSVEYVVIDSEFKAQAKLLELKEGYFEHNRWLVGQNRDEYEARFYWHIHTVDAS